MKINLCLMLNRLEYNLLGVKMIRIFFFLIGFAMMVFSFSLIIIYLNLITIGYNLSDYVNFIISRVECYFWLVGLFIVILCLYRKRENR